MSSAKMPLSLQKLEPLFFLLIQMSPEENMIQEYPYYLYAYSLVSDINIGFSHSSHTTYGRLPENKGAMKELPFSLGYCHQKKT